MRDAKRTEPADVAAAVGYHLHTVAAQSHTVAAQLHTVAAQSHTAAAQLHTVAAHLHTVAAWLQKGCSVRTGCSLYYTRLQVQTRLQPLHGCRFLRPLLPAVPLLGVRLSTLRG